MDYISLNEFINEVIDELKYTKIKLFLMRNNTR